MGEDILVGQLFSSTISFILFISFSERFRDSNDNRSLNTITIPDDDSSITTKQHIQPTIQTIQSFWTRPSLGSWDSPIKVSCILGAPPRFTFPALGCLLHLFMSVPLLTSSRPLVHICHLSTPVPLPPPVCLYIDQVYTF